MNEPMDLTNFLLTYYLLYFLYRSWRSSAESASEKEATALVQKTDERSKSRSSQWHSSNSPSTHQIADFDKNFDEQDFLKDGCTTFELVLNAYAQQDILTLNTFCSGEVARDFSAELHRLTNEGRRVQLVLVAVSSSEISAVSVADGNLDVTITFQAEVISSIRGSEGCTTDGNPDDIVITRDLWTFRRQASGSFPPWKVIATSPG